MSRLIARAVLPLRVGTALLCGLVVAVPAQAQQDVKAMKVHGALLARAKGTWQAIKEGQAAPSNVPVVALFESDLLSANGAVGVKLLGDIGDFGPLPAMESAVRFQETDKADVALTIERGIVGLANLKKEGAAKAIISVRDVPITVVLKEPGTKVGLEVYGRHPGGLGNLLKDEPTTFFIALVVEGAVELSTKKNHVNLKAAPGPASLRWDSVTQEPEVINLEKFPPELVRGEKELKRMAEMCAATEALVAKGTSKALAALAGSDKALERRIGVTAAGALDDLQQLLAALTNEKHQDAREQAILVLRSYLGRGPGHVKTLRFAMLKSRDFTLPQIKTSMQLLFGFDDQERVRPAVFELLTVMLDNKNIGVRELAHWHLVRLAPKGREIAYDAGAPADVRQKAIELWHKLSPAQNEKD